jgi:hypothetical protein
MADELTEEIQGEQQQPNRFKQAASGKMFIIIVFLFGVAFNGAWTYLFVKYTGEESGNSLCQTLITWDMVIYISLGITVVLACISTPIKLIKHGDPKLDQNPILKFCNGIMSLVSLAAVTGWIAIQVEYFKLERNQAALEEATKLVSVNIPKGAKGATIESSMETPKPVSSGHVCNNLATVNYWYFMSAYIGLAIGCVACCLVGVCMSQMDGSAVEEPSLIDNENKNNSNVELQNQEPGE